MATYRLVYWYAVCRSDYQEPGADFVEFKVDSDEQVPDMVDELLIKIMENFKRERRMTFGEITAREIVRIVPQAGRRKLSWQPENHPFGEPSGFQTLT